MSFNKAIRILCFINRFIQNAKKPKGSRQDTTITFEEIAKATEQVVKWVQHQEYLDEINKLAKGEALSGSHKLSSLTPFLDANGVMRVEGRLDNSTISYGFKHLIILPNSHILSRMIISFFHKKYLHPGQSHKSHPSTLLDRKRQSDCERRSKKVYPVLQKQSENG